MRLFEIAQYDNGFLIRLFSFFKIGIAGGTDEEGTCTTLLIAIGKLHFSWTLDWKPNVNVEESDW